MSNWSDVAPNRFVVTRVVHEKAHISRSCLSMHPINQAGLTRLIGMEYAFHYVCLLFGPFQNGTGKAVARSFRFKIGAS